MNKQEITTKLNNGFVVLARLCKDGRPSAVHFVNRTQAANAAERTGGQVYQPRLGPVFYVRLGG